MTSTTGGGATGSTDSAEQASSIITSTNPNPGDDIDDDPSSLLTKKKWEKMISRDICSFIRDHRQTFLRRIRRGIPPDHRWSVWKASVLVAEQEANNKRKKKGPGPVPQAQSGQQQQQSQQSQIKSQQGQNNNNNTNSNSTSIAGQFLDISKLVVEDSPNDNPTSNDKNDDEGEDESQQTNTKSESNKNNKNSLKPSGAVAVSGGPSSTITSASQVPQTVEEMFSSPGRSQTYRNLASKDNKWIPLIKIDISRTFPETSSFDVDQQGKLLRILSAYSNYNMEVGYCQGMNFVAGLLLLVSGTREEETFWVFVCLMEIRGLSGFFKDKFPLLRVYLKAFDTLLHEELPELHTHFQNEGVQPAVYLHQWWLTLYINCLPLQTVLVLWDCIVCEGLEILLPITLSLLKVLQSVLVRLGFEDVVKFFRSMRNGDSDCDASMIGCLLIRQSMRINLSDRVNEILRSCDPDSMGSDDFDDYSTNKKGPGVLGERTQNNNSNQGQQSQNQNQGADGSQQDGDQNGNHIVIEGVEDTSKGWVGRLQQDIVDFFQNQDGTAGPGNSSTNANGTEGGTGEEDSNQVTQSQNTEKKKKKKDKESSPRGKP